MTDAKLVGLEERFAEVKGVRMRYFVGGTGPPLILVHGLGGAAANWTELAPLLARRHGCSSRTCPGTGAPSLRRPSLGWSLLPIGSPRRRGRGHAAGTRRRPFARRDGRAAPGAQASRGRHGDRARRFRGSQRRQRVGPQRVVAVQQDQTRPRGRASPQPRFRSPFLRRLVFGFVSVADPVGLTDDAVEGFLAAQLLHTDVDGAWQALRGDDPRQELADIECPALVLWGAEDAQLPLGDAFEYTRRLRARLRVISGCGHLLIGERPDGATGRSKTSYATAASNGTTSPPDPAGAERNSTR